MDLKTDTLQHFFGNVLNIVVFLDQDDLPRFIQFFFIFIGFHILVILFLVQGRKQNAKGGSPRIVPY